VAIDTRFLKRTVGRENVLVEYASTSVTAAAEVGSIHISSASGGVGARQRACAWLWRGGTWSTLETS
jgi:hypothetical protein